MTQTLFTSVAAANSGIANNAGVHYDSDALISIFTINPTPETESDPKPEAEPDDEHEKNDDDDEDYDDDNDKFEEVESP